MGGAVHRRGGHTALLVTSVLAVAAQLWGIYRPAPPPADPLLPHIDKVFHAVGFALPVIAISFLLGRLSRWVLAVSAIHAPLSEMIQATFYTRRSGDPFDAVADLVGVAAGAGVFLLARRTAARRVRSSDG